MIYKQLKTGEAFQFHPDGMVYIRCRGGFRPGSGGQLTKFNYLTMPVLPYISSGK